MVRTLHHLAMWYLVLFAIVHMYMVFREDIMSGETRDRHDDQRHPHVQGAEPKGEKIVILATPTRARIRHDGNSHIRPTGPAGLVGHSGAAAAAAGRSSSRRGS